MFADDRVGRSRRGCRTARAPGLILISDGPQLPRSRGGRPQSPAGLEREDSGPRLPRAPRGAQLGGGGSTPPGPSSLGDNLLCSLCVHTANSQVGGGETAKAVSRPTVQATKEEKGEGRRGGREARRRGRYPLLPESTPRMLMGSPSRSGGPFSGPPSARRSDRLVGRKRTKLPARAGSGPGAPRGMGGPRPRRPAPCPPRARPRPGPAPPPPLTPPSPRGSGSSEGTRARGRGSGGSGGRPAGGRRRGAGEEAGDGGRVRPRAAESGRVPTAILQQFPCVMAPVS